MFFEQRPTDIFIKRVSEEIIQVSKSFI